MEAAMEVATAYEQVTRTRLEALERRFEEHEDNQNRQFAEIKQDLREIKSELSKRLPMWVTVLLTISGTIVGAAVSRALW